MLGRERTNRGKGGPGQRGRGRRRDRDRERDEKRDPFEDRTVFIRRVAKVVKGGRRFNFSSLVVVGDRNGKVGIGLGKGADVALSLGKAGKRARKQLFTVPRLNTTVPHEIIGHFGASRVLLRPAAPGTGIIAGAAVRAVLELAGYRDILTKALGSRNPLNVVRATVVALQSLKNPVEVARRRNLTVKEMLGFEITDPVLLGAAPAAAAVPDTIDEAGETNETK